MNKRRTARLNSIMKIVGKANEDYLNNEENQRESIEEATTTDKEVINKNHDYTLRNLTNTAYCEESDKDVSNEDFSPDVSEYVPSPERLSNLDRGKSSSSIGGDSDYVDDATKNILRTPSTISNISLILNAADFISSPSPTVNINNKICNSESTPTSSHALNESSLQRSSKRCLNQIFQNCNQLSPSCSTIDAYEDDKHEEQPRTLDANDLDATLQPENNTDSMLTDETMIGNESTTTIQNQLILTHTEQNNDTYDDQSFATVSLENHVEKNQESTSKKITRKRRQNITERQDVKSKKLKNSGEAYVGCRSKKLHEKKVLKGSCKCSKKCGEKIDQEHREQLMQQYYKTGDHELQWQYIVNHTVAEDVKRITVSRKRNRIQSIKYFFIINTEKVYVCKTFFINTLSISHQTVYTALEKVKLNESLIDKRGLHGNRPRRMPLETEENIVKHIELFPCIESHYIRKKSTRQYLSTLLNISKMYRLYKAWFGQGNFSCPMASKRQYETIFNTKFNYSFFKPKKDQCSICSRYRQADSNARENLQEKHDKHIKNKERVRQIKTEEKNTANPSETTIAIFDLEKVLNIPQSEVGSFHYKRKFPVYNFTVYNAIMSTGYCFVWHAQIAKRGANEIGSCLWQFLLNEKQRGIKNISFYSDGCCGQNKNRFIFALYLFAAVKLQLNITHRFFETGHGQSEADSMHSNIERALKNRVVYTPEQIYAIIMNAKVNGESYNVKEMLQKDFFNIKELINNKNWIKDVAGQKITWTKIMEVGVSSAEPSVLKYKYNVDEEYFRLNTESVQKLRSKRGSRQTPNSLASPNPALETELLVLHTQLLPISKALYDDLMSLCKAGDIPSYYHAFYESLHYVNNSEINNDDEDNDQE